MPSTDACIEIVETMPEVLEKQILEYLITKKASAYSRITRDDLVFVLFDKLVSSEELVNSLEDLQIRRAVKELVRQGFAVFPDSGQPGYYIGKQGDHDRTFGELVRRRKALDDQIKFVRSVNLKY